MKEQAEYNIANAEANLDKLFLSRNEEEKSELRVEIEDSFKKAIQADPNNPEVYYRIACLKYDTAEYEGRDTIVNILIIALEKAIEMDKIYIEDNPGEIYFRKVMSENKTETDDNELAGVTDRTEDAASNFIIYESELFSEIKGFIRLIFEHIIEKDNLEDSRIYTESIDLVIENEAYKTNNYQTIIDINTTFIFNDLNKIIKFYPEWHYPYFMIGYYKMIALEDYEGSIEYWNKVLQLKPNSASAYYNRGEAKYYIKDYTGAQNDYNKAISINPNEGAYYED
jgi:tetratricopeptide (TPR) repeat protein